MKELKIDPVRQKAIILLKWLSFFCILGYACWLVLRDDQLMQTPEFILDRLSSSVNLVLLITVFILTPINWGIEALKWKIAAHRLAPMRFRTAYVSVLRGLALGFITPRSIGDYLGRIVDLPAHQRLEAIGGLAFVRISSFFWTALFGVYGLFVFYAPRNFSRTTFPLTYIIGGAVIIIFILTTCTFYRKAIIRKLENHLKPKWMRFVRVLRDYRNEVITSVVLLSLLRYLVFTSQFILLLFIGSGNTSFWMMFCAISATYLVKSLAFSFNFLTDIGIREVAAITFLSHVGLDNGIIAICSMLLWGINILFPTLAGSILLVATKFRQWKSSSPS